MPKNPNPPDAGFTVSPYQNLVYAPVHCHPQTEDQQHFMALSAEWLFGVLSGVYGLTTCSEVHSRARSPAKGQIPGAFATGRV
jgi:hypothetical protein